jgi:hypothetical protein
MKHDITMAILATNSKQKYIDRIMDLEPYLLLNRTKSTKIDLVGDNCEKPSGIPDSFFWFKPKHSSVTKKFWCYLDSLNIEKLPKWLVQCDDDCATDVGKLLEMLESYYDHNDPICLEATQNYDFSTPFYPLIRSFMPSIIHYSSSEWQNSNMIHHHSWGTHVFSYGLLRKIKEWKRFHEWCNSIYNISDGFADQMPSLLALSLKAPCCEAKFLHSFFNMNEFTGINENGHFAQIHYTHRLIPDWNKFTGLIKNKTYPSVIRSETKKIENQIPKAINRYTFKKNKISIKAYSKLRPREQMVIDLFNNGSAEINGVKNLTWTMSANGEMIVYNRKENKTVAEIKNINSKGDFIVKMNLNNNDNGLVWNGKEI